MIKMELHDFENKVYDQNQAHQVDKHYVEVPIFL